MTKTVHRTCRGSIPETAAALSLLPTATICLPKTVDFSKNSNAITSDNAVRNDADIPMPSIGRANAWIVAPM